MKSLLIFSLTAFSFQFANADLVYFSGTTDENKACIVTLNKAGTDSNSTRTRLYVDSEEKFMSLSGMNIKAKIADFVSEYDATKDDADLSMFAFNNKTGMFNNTVGTESVLFKLNNKNQPKEALFVRTKIGWWSGKERIVEEIHCY